jgi:hypothetical protein
MHRGNLASYMRSSLHSSSNGAAGGPTAA